MKLYAWDEINNEIAAMDRKELNEINEEGGWVEVAFDPGTGVRTLEAWPHQALEVEAESMEAARVAFSQIPIYASYNND